MTSIELIRIKIIMKTMLNYQNPKKERSLLEFKMREEKKTNIQALINNIKMIQYSPVYQSPEEELQAVYIILLVVIIKVWEAYLDLNQQRERSQNHQCIMTLQEENCMKQSLRNSWLIKVKSISKIRNQKKCKKRTLIGIQKDRNRQLNLHKDSYRNLVRNLTMTRVL